MKLFSIVRKIVFSSISFCVLGIVIQISYLAVAFWTLGTVFSYSYILFALLGLILSVYVINTSASPDYKLIWIFTILAFPLFGSMLYIFFGLSGIKEATVRHSLKKHELSAIHPREIAQQASYITGFCRTDISSGDNIKYYTNGEQLFPELLEEIKKAKEYIFLEFFILEHGVMWDSILSVLKEKAAKGVDVRVIYDDMGCLLTLPRNYYKELKKYGIKCCVFGRLKPFWTKNMNNRDHRKMLIIDGKTALTGGINLADEYINAYEKHGYWKDSAVIIKGNCVNSFTDEFLRLWCLLSNENYDYKQINRIPHNNSPIRNAVIPFFDSPYDNEQLARNIYINMLNNAKRYVYITTPYLIPDSETLQALIMAAKNGIDVRIITPHIPDKALVHCVTRTYYKQLITNGVRIYEFQPGFIHAKSIVSDDSVAVVGTINLDFRSLYLHHECGIWIYNDSSINDIKRDFTDTLLLCEQISIDKTNVRNPIKRLFIALLRFFSPLM